MAWTGYQIFLAFLMVITGSINTLATKWADESFSVGSDGQKRKFNHPFLQAVAMFFGEFLCFLAFKVMLFYYKRQDYTEETLPESVNGNRDFNPFIFMPPALCDMTATSLMYIGLNLTNSSSFQMLRGALIIFTGLLSIIFLKRRLKLYHWIGMLLVMGGLIIVGLSDFETSKGDNHNSTNTNHPTDNNLSDRYTILGDVLIILAQIVAATQMIVEEKYVSGRNVSPLQAVGWEGIFGFITLSILLVPMYFIHVGNGIFKNPHGQIEDAIDGFYQIANSWQVATGLTGTILSIAFFNFAGISVTKQLSATTRTVLDSIRTVIIWVFSMIIGQEIFSVYKLGGFIVLLIGMCVYNDVLFRPMFGRFCRKNQETLVISEENEEDGYSQDIIS